MSGLDELSREELLALFAAQARTIEALTAMVETLTARVSVLEAENAELKVENDRVEAPVGAQLAELVAATLC